MAHYVQRLAGVISLIAFAAPLWAQDIAVLGLLADRAMVKIDGETHILKVGESYEDIALIAVSSQEARLRIKGKEQVFGLGQDRGGVQKKEENSDSVEISANARRQFITSGMINGRVVEFLVDTGANTVSMNRKDAARLGVDYRRLGTVGMSATANGNVKNWHVLLDKVKVGSITVISVDATIRDTEDDMPVLLGMSFLGRVKLEHNENRLKLTAK
jgi:aspartyl protease family protein